MNQYQRRKQISLSQLIEQDERNEAREKKRPFHPRRLEVEHELLNKYKPELSQLWGKQWRARCEEIQLEVERILFPTEPTCT